MGAGDGHGNTHPQAPRFHPRWFELLGKLDAFVTCRLYAQGEDVHVGIWPGNLRNTEDHASSPRKVEVLVLRFPAMRREFPVDFPHLDLILQRCPRSPRQWWLLRRRTKRWLDHRACDRSRMPVASNALIATKFAVNAKTSTSLDTIHVQT